MKQWIPQFNLTHSIAPAEKDAAALPLESQGFVTLGFICSFFFFY